MLIPPRQARSGRTLNAILDATERLLEERSFDRLTIQDITRQARVATGSFYRRFDQKDALLEVLFARYLADTEELAAELAAERDWAAEPLEARVRRTCEVMVETFRRRRGVSRSAQLHYLRFPELITPELRGRLGGIYTELAEIIRGGRGRPGIVHRDPDRAARFAIELAASMCRAKILFNDHPVPDASGCDDTALIGELTRALLAYLTTSEGET